MNPFRLPSLHRQSAQSGGELDVSERSELGHHFCQRRIFIWVIVQVKCLLSGFTRDRNIGPKQDIHFRSLIYGPCAARRCIMAPVQTFGKAANGTGWQRQLQLTLKVANWQWMGRKGAKKGEGSWSAHRAGPLAAGVRSRRRSREAAGRVRSVRFGLTEEEFDEVGAAAAEAGLAKGAYAAQATLAAARGRMNPADSPLRQALTEFIRAAGLVRRIGVNLNQAVAKLNTTGQRSGDLLPYAIESMRRVERLDQAAEELRRRLR